MTSAVLMWGIAVVCSPSWPRYQPLISTSWITLDGQFFLSLLQCIPPRGFGDKTIEAICNVDSQKFLFTISIPNIIIDVTLLTIPIPYVITLNTAKSQKRAILSVFFLGALYANPTPSICCFDIHQADTRQCLHCLHFAARRSSHCHDLYGTGINV
ncbi:hypothetical protein GGR51DRAFT_435897 [Nemania sp. FL0031]|nr:hypothetical protein GGR51DRAFT_435897 [Nemania sp. FL0031]